MISSIYKKSISLYVGLLFISSSVANAQPQLEMYGVKINVTDMPKAINFYTSVLGFSVQAGDSTVNEILLKPATGEDCVLLHKVNYLLPIEDNEARATLTLQVNNLDSTITLLKSKGINFGNYSKRKEGVGYAIYIDDPFGTRISLLHETVVDNPHFEEPRIYNYGFYIADMESSQKFYITQMGFKIRSEKYLPWDLPLNLWNGSFAFMLHYRTTLEAIHYNSADNEHIVILFKTKNLKQAESILKENGVIVQNNKENSIAGKLLSFYDTYGYISQILGPKQ